MPSITKSFRFEAAHRLLKHSGQCRHLHGHSYRAEITISSHMLDNMGMVVDFQDVKDTIGKWIKDNWDHNGIFHKDDPFLQAYYDNIEPRQPYLMQSNPTAENMARELYFQANAMFRSKTWLSVDSVTIHETETSSATHTIKG